VEATVVRRILTDCGRDEAVALTSRLVGFQTVAAIGPAPSNPQFGAMASFLEQWAKDASLGFRVVGEHDAWEITLPGRSKERRLAWIAHGDVVPVNEPPAVLGAGVVPNGWTVSPFEAVVKDGKLYGRGSEDDKAPIAAILLAMREVRAAGILPDGEVALVIGTAEEEDWEGMRRYASQAPKARYTVSVDADYPVVVAQSGFVSWGFRAPLGLAPRGGRAPWVRELHGGMFLTQVPDLAWMTLEPRGETLKALRTRMDRIAREDLEARRKLEPSSTYRFDLQEADGHNPSLKLVVHGTSVHASVAEQGHNALWPLAAIATKVGIAPGGARDVLASIAGELDGDHHGARLGVACEDAFMGKLVVAPTLLRIDQGWVSLGVNMRRPRGTTKEQFEASLRDALEGLRKKHGASIEANPKQYVGEPVAVDASSELVTGLLGIYRDLTGKDGEPRALRGGTYARLFDGAVDFGPGMVGRPYTGHGADEYVALDALGLTVRAMGEVLLRLGGAPFSQRPASTSS